MSYFPDALLKISKATGHKFFCWENEKRERYAELPEMVRKITKNYFKNFQYPPLKIVHFQCLNLNLLENLVQSRLNMTKKI